MVLLHHPVDSILAELAGQELIEEEDETLADVTVVEILTTIHCLGPVIPLWAPVPLVRTRERRSDTGLVKRTHLKDSS